MSRTRINLLDNSLPEDETFRPAGQKYSEFLLTVNPNKTFISRKTPGFDEMVERLRKLCDWVLEKNNLIRILRFSSPEGQPERSLEHHRMMISEIDPDRKAAVEWGKTQHRIHCHITFWIKHYTHLQVNTEIFDKICSKFLDQPVGSFHTDIKANGREGFKNYVGKYDNI